MTKDEAVRILEESKDPFVVKSMREWEEWDRKFIVAVDMAIKALDQVEDVEKVLAKKLPCVIIKLPIK